MTSSILSFSLLILLASSPKKPKSKKHNTGPGPLSQTPQISHEGTKESPIAPDDDDDVPNAYFPRASENGIRKDRKKNLHAAGVFHSIKDNKGSPCQQQLGLEVVVMCRGVRKWICDIRSGDTTPKKQR
ncbi:hypothetical protein GGU10DRAFT_153269 [Lentinula aff. detonsa]|uniref:Uncharacterized protein n=1 Tax=Lentinula aff. detonsa TaxID=2804958 RepID=A0AA38NN75_9AGAR|nr:hypothetical protein GGU10DRAFT_153269 [Lentinula aff. detonsa]